MDMKVHENRGSRIVQHQATKDVEKTISKDTIQSVISVEDILTCNNTSENRGITQDSHSTTKSIESDNSPECASIRLPVVASLTTSLDSKLQSYPSKSDGVIKRFLSTSFSNSDESSDSDYVESEPAAGSDSSGRITSSSGELLTDPATSLCSGSDASSDHSCGHLKTSSHSSNCSVACRGHFLTRKRHRSSCHISSQFSEPKPAVSHFISDEEEIDAFMENSRGNSSDSFPEYEVLYNNSQSSVGATPRFALREATETHESTTPSPDRKKLKECSGNLMMAKAADVIAKKLSGIGDDDSALGAANLSVSEYVEGFTLVKTPEQLVQSKEPGFTQDGSCSVFQASEPPTGKERLDDMSAQSMKSEQERIVSSAYETGSDSNPAAQLEKIPVADSGLPQRQFEGPAALDAGRSRYSTPFDCGGKQLSPNDKSIPKEKYANCNLLPPPRDNEIEFIIEEFPALQSSQSGPLRLYSHIKYFHGVAFRILVFPKGNNSDRLGNVARDLSAYVAVDPSESLPPECANKWCVQRCDYQLFVVNWRNWKDLSILKNEQYTFVPDDVDRGWRSIVPTDALKIGEFLGPAGQFIIRAQIVPRSVDASFHLHQGRRDTNYIGIRNQGATCYLNSLVQALYHIGQFRRSVFELTLDTGEQSLKESVNDDREEPRQWYRKNQLIGQESTDLDTGDDEQSDGEDDPKALQRFSSEEIRDAFMSDHKQRSKADSAEGRGVALALQTLFLKLSTSNDVVTTDDLIQSFGWQSNESLMQQDAHELNRLLCDRLESQMNGTPAEGSIAKLFMGEFENYIECLDVSYSSCRREKFYDLQLVINGMKDMYDSLRKYVSEEILEGENAYDAEHYGRQRAKKGTRFIQFPPVIQFDLKRFTFDLTRMDMVKVYERFEYPAKLDLNCVLEGAGVYDLFCIIVHAGEVGSGHYYVLTRPGGQKWWMRFDDEKVYYVTAHSALADCYGGYDSGCWNHMKACEDPAYTSDSRILKLYSAYILFYVKSNCSAAILKEPDPNEVNPQLVRKIFHEEALQRKRLKIQKHIQRFVTVRYVTEACLRGHDKFLSSLESIPYCFEIQISRDVSIFNLWKSIDAAVEAQELVDPLLQEAHASYYIGLWYFDTLHNSSQNQRISDSRLMPCHMSEATKRQFTVGDHLSWISMHLKCLWKPILPIFIHPLRVRQRSKIRSLMNLTSSIFETRLFIAKVFNPGRQRLRRPEDQTLTIVAVPRLKFEKDRRVSPGLQLLFEVAAALNEHPKPLEALNKIKDAEVKEFLINLQALTSPLARSKPISEESLGVSNCYLEIDGFFEPLPSTGAAFADKLETARTTHSEEGCAIVVFSLSANVDDAYAQMSTELRDSGLTASEYEEDYEAVDGVSDSYFQDDSAQSKATQHPSSFHQSANALDTPQVITKLPDEATEGADASEIPSRENDAISLDGGPTPRPARRCHPPRVPEDPSLNPIDWYYSLTMSKISVILKLYDPLSIISRWENSAGHPMTYYQENGNSEAKPAHDDPSFDFSETVTKKSDSDQAQDEHDMRGCDKRVNIETCWKRYPRCPVLKEVTTEIDLRWPSYIAFSRLAWLLGEHEHHIVVMANPPLSEDTLSFSFSQHEMLSSEVHHDEFLCPTPPRNRFKSASGYPLSELHSILASRQAQPRYRELSYPKHKQYPSDIQYHFAIIPKSVRSASLGWAWSGPSSGAVQSSHLRTVSVRVMNEKVQNVGCVLVDVDVLKPPPIQDFLSTVKKQFTAAMCERGAPKDERCRLVWVGSPMALSGQGSCRQIVNVPKALEILDDTSFKSRLTLFERGFQFDTPLRIEPDFTPEEYRELLSPDPTLKKILVLHQCDQDRYFGHPFFILVEKIDTMKAIKGKIQAKLDLPSDIFSNWCLLLHNESHSSFLRDDEIPNFRGHWLVASHNSLHVELTQPKSMQLHI